MPVTAEIVEFNDKLSGSPELVNSDPYGDGWMVKVKVQDVGELESLMDADSYKSMIGQ
jgi:glycine cleavage system H protein